MLPKYGKIPQNHFEFSESPKEWNASFRSKTDSTLHLELPNIGNVSLSKGYARLFLAILTFNCQKSISTLLS